MAYDESRARKVCELIADGMSLRTACKQEGMPSVAAFLDWCADRPDLADRYARARQTMLDVLAEDILHISDTPVEGVITKTSEDGVEETRADMIHHRKLQVDARKWILSKLQPQKYGEKLALGGDKDQPLIVTVKKLSDTEKDPA